MRTAAVSAVATKVNGCVHSIHMILTALINETTCDSMECGHWKPD